MGERLPMDNAEQPAANAIEKSVCWACLSEIEPGKPCPHCKTELTEPRYYFRRALFLGLLILLAIASVQALRTLKEFQASHAAEIGQILQKNEASLPGLRKTAASLRQQLTSAGSQVASGTQDAGELARIQSDWACVASQQLAAEEDVQVLSKQAEEWDRPLPVVLYNFAVARVRILTGEAINGPSTRVAGDENLDQARRTMKEKAAAALKLPVKSK